MSLEFDQLMELWTRRLPEGGAAVDAFARLYARELTVNGVPTKLEALVERARALQSAYTELSGTLLARAESATHVTFVFKMRGRHVGPLPTPLGIVPPTGKFTERQVMDLLRVQDGRIHEVWMTADELSALAGIGVLQLGV